MKMPHSHGSEAALIGSVLINPDMLFEVADIQPDDFYKLPHRAAWKAILQLFNAKTNIDLATVASRLSQNKSDVTFTELSKMVDAAYNSLNAADYAKTVREMALRRNLLIYAQDIAQRSVATDADINEAIDAAHKLLRNIGSADANDIITMSQAVKEFDERISSGIDGNILSTGMPDIDRFLDGGVRMGLTYMLAAKPKMRKTQLWAQMALGIAERGNGVVMYSAEMSVDALVRRAISARGKIREEFLYQAKHMEQLNGKLDEYYRQIESLAQLPVYITKKQRWSPESIRSSLMNLMREHEIKAVFVDYLGRLSDGPGDKKEYEQLTNKTRDIVSLSREFGVAVVVVHTVNAGGDLRGGEGPQYEVDLAMTLESKKEETEGFSFDAPVIDNTIWLKDKLRRYGSQKPPVKLVGSPDYPLVMPAAYGDAR